MIKKRKKYIIAIVCALLAIFLVFLSDDDKYIVRNIDRIDRADTIRLVSDGSITDIPFNEEMIELVSYGGFTIKIDDWIESMFTPYGDELIELDVNVTYMNGDSILATADVYKANETTDRYILYMNNVYWSSNSFYIEELLSKIE